MCYCDAQTMQTKFARFCQKSSGHYKLDPLKDFEKSTRLIVTPEISHILFTFFDFIFLFCLPILKVSCVELKWLKSLNFEGPILVHQIFSNLIFPYLLAHSEIVMMCSLHN